MYCRNCGEPLNDNDRVCPACGTPVEKAAPAGSDQGAPKSGPQTYSYQEGTTQQTYNYQGSTYQSSEDSGSIGWGILGCCIPLVGLILFLVWKDTKPLSAKKAGIGAIIGVVACVVCYLLLFVIMGVGAAMLGASGELDMTELEQYLEESAKIFSWNLTL